MHAFSSGDVREEAPPPVPLAAVVLVAVLLCSGCHAGVPELIRIGTLFDSGSELDEAAVRHSVEFTNERSKLLPKSRLYAVGENATYGDSFKASRKACTLARWGIGALLGPSSPASSVHVQSVCDALEIPHIETREDFRSIREDQFFVNLYPHPSSLAKLLTQLVRSWKWDRYALLYESPEGLLRLKELLQHSSPDDHMRITVRSLRADGGDYGPLLKHLKKIGETHIIVDCSLQEVRPVLEAARRLEMLTPYHNYIFTNLDAHSLDLKEFIQSDTNVTTLRLIDPGREDVASAFKDWMFGELHMGRRVNMAESTVKVQEALLYDAIQLYAKALDSLGRTQDVQMRSLSCDSEEKWRHGRELLNALRGTEIHGLTGRVHLDSYGFRSNFDMDVVKFKRDGSAPKIGQWDAINGMNFTQTYGEIYKEIISRLENKTLTVITAENPPYILKKKNRESPSEADGLEGFAVDLMQEIAAELKFNYTMKLIEGNIYGVKDPETKEWNGMIRELIDWKADLAIVDLTITHERQEAVDFTTPFMNLGISILYKKPKPSSPSLFSFLSPFSPGVWIYVVTAYLGVSILLYLTARMCSKEWDNPNPCIRDPDYLENKFTISNCFWFTIGSLMQQGSDITPKAIPTRIIAAMWWFFTLIIISSYTANLAAFLTISRMESPISGVDDLARQTKIKYGCKMSGSTYTFFRDSKLETYQHLFAVMESQKPSVFTRTNQEGVNRVLKENGGYAFFMESTSIEYHVEGDCELQQIGGLLDSKGYGIAMPKKSPYIEAFNKQILKLQQENRLHILKNKWWKEHRMGAGCEKETAQAVTSAAELKLANVGGVFVVLLFGVGCSCLLALIEFFWKSRKIAIEERATFCTEIGKEFLFVLKCKGTKPVRKKMRLASSNDLDLREVIYDD